MIEKIIHIQFRKGDILRHRKPPIHRNPVCYTRQNKVIYLYFKYFLKVFLFTDKKVLVGHGRSNDMLNLRQKYKV